VRRSPVAGINHRRICACAALFAVLEEGEVMAIDAAFADLDVGVSRLQVGLDVPTKKRSIKWASKRCVYSRFVHKNIWEVCPDNRRVEEILDLLRSTRSAIITMCFGKVTSEEREKLILYIRNIGLRIINLEENYLNDKPSDFAPTDKLIEEEKKVRAEVAAGLKRA